MILIAQSIDLMKSQSAENRTKHHTDLYQSQNLVIRRGQPFQMWVTLSRPLDRNTDTLHLDLKTGGSSDGGLDYHNPSSVGLFSVFKHEAGTASSKAHC